MLQVVDLFLSVVSMGGVEKTYSRYSRGCAMTSHKPAVVVYCLSFLSIAGQLSGLDHVTVR
jgi:hypothetical protein